jgi:F-type H+-transporting ATPase subunit c
MNVNAYIAIAAAIAVFTGAGAGIGISIATAKAAEAVSRQPEASGKIMSITLLGTALAEATAIYGFVIAIILLLLKWGT